MVKLCEFSVLTLKVEQYKKIPNINNLYGIVKLKSKYLALN